MAVNNIYSKNGKLKMVHIGNGLTMSNRSVTCNAYISLDSSLSSAGYNSTNPSTFAGTTTDTSKVSSWAELILDTSIIPSGSTIDFAILAWIGSNSGVNINSPVTLEFPNGTNTSITPDLTLNNTGNLPDGGYGRCANITNLLKQNGPNGGVFKLRSIQTGPPSFGCGWTVIMVYAHPNLPFKNVNLYAGSLVTNETVTLDKIFTPAAGTVKANVFTQSFSGGADEIGDGLNLNSKPLQGPRNPANNYFCSQVLDYKGNNMTTGSFGNRTTNSGQVPNNTKASYDQVYVNADGYLANSANTAILQNIAAGDLSIITFVGLEVDVVIATLVPVKSVNKAIGKIGDELIYTITIPNEGNLTAENVIFTDSLSSGQDFVPGSFKVDNISTPGDIVLGINIGNIPPFSSKVVSFSSKINSQAGTSVTNVAKVNYAYSPNSSTIVNASTITNTVKTIILEDNTSLKKSVDKTIIRTGEEVTYTLIFKNNSSKSTLTNLIFKDSIPITTSYVSNSLIINSITIINADLTSGVPLNISLPPLESITITFKVIGNGLNGSFVNSGEFSYKISVDGSSIDGTVTSNEVSTIYKNLELSIKKYVDKIYVDRGDTILYTLEVLNTGNIDLENTIIKDTIPEGTFFLNGSTTVDFTPNSGSPESGINIGLIKFNTVKTITFKVIVK